MLRQIIKLEGTVTNVNLPDLDVTNAEIDVAQIQSIASWPALASWGVNDATTGFLDRLTADIRLANGATAVGSRLSAGGTPSLIGYAPNNINQPILSPLTVDAGFTIGLVARTGVSFGSYSSGTGAWWLVNDNSAASPTLGALRFSFGLVVSTFAEYAEAGGKIMNASDWDRIVLIADPSAGTVKLRVNGVLVVTKTGLTAAIMSTILDEFAMGLFSTGVQSFRAAQYRSPIAFNQPLAGTELTQLEAMLLEKSLGG